MFKWSSFVFVVLGGVFACSSVPESKASTPKPNPAPPTMLQQVNVSNLYDTTCAKCHGDRGQGGGGGTRTLLTKEKFDQKNDRPYFDAIHNGVPDAGMEAYGQTLSDEAIWALVVHIRELQSRGLREAGESPKPVNGVYQGQRHKYKVETVVDTGQGLQVPWAIEWLPDGRMVVTNKPGSLMVIKNGQPTTVEGIPAVLDNGQGGLMDVAVHPDYAKNGWIYLSFSDPAKEGASGSFTKLVRGKLAFDGDKARWTDQQTIFEAPHDNYSRSGIHFGDRIVFDGKGHIFFSIGERGNGERAQDLSRPNGKIFRVNEDGTIPADNPFANSAVWSYGHRNPQGLVFDLDGVLWDTEHAPRGGDEVNRIEKGANYGWPLVSFGINYNDSPLVVPWPKPDQKINMPVFRWLPSTGACGLDVVQGSAFPDWKGDLVAGGLSGQNVDRLRIKDGQLVEREELIYRLGRVRDVKVGPDGLVYVALNDPDKIIRLAPSN